MKIIFRIENNWLFNNQVEDFKAEWNLPVLPRIGEKIHPLLIINQINEEINIDTYNITSEARATYNSISSVKDWLHDTLAAYGCRVTDIFYIPVTRNSIDIETVIYINQNIYE